MIKFDNVEKVYGKDIIALSGVSFTVNDGEFFFIVGPSGAGKSTLIRLLTRQEKPSSGDIFFDDLSIPQIPKSMLSFYRQKLGIVFQDLKLLENMTIRENIEFALQITNKKPNEIKETTDYLLSVIALEDRQDLFPPALSGGEKQKVAIARALANDPKIIIADEPTGNLDPNTSIQIMDLLKKINSWGTTVMIVTHDHDLVDAMKTRVIRIESGRLVSDAIGGYSIGEGVKGFVNMDALKDTEKRGPNSCKDKKVSEKKEIKNRQEKESKEMEAELLIDSLVSEMMSTPGSDINIKNDTKSENADGENISVGKVDIKSLGLDSAIEKKLIRNKIKIIDDILDLSEDDLISLGFNEEDLEEILTKINTLK